MLRLASEHLTSALASDFWGLADRRAIQTPEGGLDISEHDKNPVRLDLATLRYQIGQGRYERVSFCIWNRDAAQLEKCRGAFLSGEPHARRRDKTSHDVLLWLAQLRGDNLRCSVQQRTLFLLRQAAVRVN